MTLWVTGGAALDVIVTSRFYDTKPGRYGAAFEDEVETAINRIAADPRLYSPVEDGVPGREIREYYIKRFQQRVIYTVSVEDVAVIAVVHATSRPESWHDRLTPDT